MSFHLPDISYNNADLSFVNRASFFMKCGGLANGENIYLEYINCGKLARC